MKLPQDDDSHYLGWFESPRSNYALDGNGKSHVIREQSFWLCVEACVCRLIGADSVEIDCRTGPVS